MQLEIFNMCSPREPIEWGWDIIQAFPGERNGLKNVTGLAKVHKKIVLANVALIS